MNTYLYPKKVNEAKYKKKICVIHCVYPAFLLFIEIKPDWTIFKYVRINVCLMNILILNI